MASVLEMRRLLDLGLPLENVIFSSTVKVPAHVQEAVRYGIDRFAFDSATEIEKIATFAPGSRVILRLEVPHQGSRWPLAAKFGVPAAEAVDLLRQAKDAGLHPYGVSFHVGSQCLRKESWTEAVEICARVWRQAQQAGIRLRLLNLGGGLPSRYTEDTPSVSEIGSHLTHRLADLFDDDVEYAIEPGRFISADAGSIVTTVIGNAVRRGKPWIFVDLSIYAGLLEVIGGWTYPMLTSQDQLPKRPTTLAGPTCDSTDILAVDAALPNLEVGDRVVLLQTGAYTTSYKDYNGFGFPEVVVTDEASSAGGLRSAA